MGNYIQYNNDLEVVDAITQHGIAAVVKIRLEHVSRTIKKLLDEDLIFVRSSKILNYPRRRKAYFLTKKGLKYNREIKLWFEEKKFLVHTLDGELREITYGQLDNFLNIELTHLEVLEYISTSKNKIMDLNQVILNKK